jgi:hypothetical protein
MYPLAQQMATAERCVISWWHNEITCTIMLLLGENNWPHFRMTQWNNVHNHASAQREQLTTFRKARQLTVFKVCTLGNVCFFVIFKWDIPVVYFSVLNRSINFSLIQLYCINRFKRTWLHVSALLCTDHCSEMLCTAKMLAFMLHRTVKNSD